MLKSLCDKHNLKWLRISMSHHQFSNLREIFKSDLTNKLMEDVISLDFMDRPCNCNKRSFVNGRCAFGGNCRKCVVIYEAKCKICSSCYLGNTQQPLKTRTGQHLHDVVKLVNRDESSDSFAAHFAEHFKASGTDATVGLAREMVEVKILWQGDPIKCMKSFGKKTCSLCMQERLEILKRSKEDPG